MLFTKPANLNGAELIAELAAVGVIVERVVLEADGQLNIDVATKDSAKVDKVLTSHNGTIIAPEPTISEKLASVGLSLEELKAALLA